MYKSFTTEAGIFIPREALLKIKDYNKVAVLITLINHSKRVGHNTFWLHLVKASELYPSETLAEQCCLTPYDLRIALKGITTRDNTGVQSFFHTRKDTANRTHFRINWAFFEKVFGAESYFVVLSKMERPWA